MPAPKIFKDCPYSNRGSGSFRSSLSRNLFAAREGSHRKSSSPLSNGWFLFNLFPCFKEGWWFASSSRLETSKRVPENSSLSDVMSSQCSSVSKKGRLVHKHQFERCLLSSSDCVSTQEISSIQLQESGLPIKGPTDRPVFGPLSFHEVHDCSSTSAVDERDANPDLPRRLAAVFTHKTTSCLRHHAALGACAAAGSCSQRGKVLSESTLFAPPQASALVEQQFAIEPCKTSSTADCCLM